MKVHLGVVLGGELVATGSAQEVSLSSMGAEVDQERAIGPKPRFSAYTCS